MATYTSKLSIKSRRMMRDFTPDGDLGKRAWRRADWESFDHDWAGKHAYPQARTRVASCWTVRSVYFAFDCRYSTLNVYQDGDAERDKWGLWERDVVEVFVNPEPARQNHYYEFEVAPNNLWIDLEINLGREPFNDAGWNSGFAHATHIGKTAWTCEMRIPAAPMTSPDYQIRPGSDWRLNFFRADGVGNNSTRRLLSWSPTLTPKPQFHVPSRFGVIHFVK